MASRVGIYLPYLPFLSDCVMILTKGFLAVLQAMADKLIPGIPPTLRIHIVSQVAEGGSEDTSDSGKRTVVQRVLDGHVERNNALKERQGTFALLSSRMLQGFGADLLN